MRFVLLFITVALVSFSPITGWGAEASPVIFSKGYKAISLTASALAAGKEARLDAAMPEPVRFLLKRGSQNTIALTAAYGTSEENLLATIPEDMQGFDEKGELEEGFSIQIVVGDLNGDKVPELLVATGDDLAILTVAVFTYTPQGKNRFQCTGLIVGQKNIHVEPDGTLTAPFGSQGLFTEYVIASDGKPEEKK